MMTDGDRLGGEGAELAGQLPTQRLAQEARNLLEAFAERVLASVGDKVSDKVDEVSQGLLDKLGNEDGGGPGVKAAVSGLTALTEGKSPVRAALGAGMTGLKEKVKGFFGGDRGTKSRKVTNKVTNIVESIDVGVPLRLAYDQWTRLEDFPSFMKKVESVERPEEHTSNWKAQVLWSHRTWESNVLEQVPDDHIVWRSKGAKGYVDGAVSFSELAPNLTRILLVMEYHPQGLFEHTGNLWRAQGRRARLDFKHFRRHLMAHAILKPEEIEGWRGEIRDGEVVKTHEEAMEEERAREEAEAPEEETIEEFEEQEAPEEEEEPEPGAAAEAEPWEEAELEEEPEQPRRARRRPAAERERPRPRPAHRRPVARSESEEPEEERPAPARRPRRRAPRAPDEENVRHESKGREIT